MASSAPQPATEAPPMHDEHEENDDSILEADNDADSAFESTGANSETTSLADMYKGYIEQGRRYQSLRSEAYYIPADDKAWESMDAGHMLFLILDCQRSNTLFRSPLSPNAQNIIDLGTGPGSWALDVADKWPNYVVRGVDLFPPPQPFTAPNCIFEVDDITKTWTWTTPFDLCHMRNLLGSMSHHEWDALYKRIYDNTAPGGWIEHVEQDVGVYCDDNSWPKDSMLRNWKPLFLDCAAKAGRPLDTMDRIEDCVRSAGFTNIHHSDYKLPLGRWAKLKEYKDAGQVCTNMWKVGMDGWVMFLLTHFGQPTPWTADEVQVYCAKARSELDKGYHIYNKAKRVWAQKPYDAEPRVARTEPIVQTFETSPAQEKPVAKTEGKTGAESKKPRAAKSASPETQGPTKKQRVDDESVAKKA